MRQVLEVVSGSRGVSPEALAEAVHRNNEVFLKKKNAVQCGSMRMLQTEVCSHAICEIWV